MRSLPPLLLLTACYRAPDLPVTPYEVPVLTSASTGLRETCAPARLVRVQRVLDGDTVELPPANGNPPETVRLLGINAPEIAHNDTPAECYGDPAAAETSRVLLNRPVTLTFDKSCTDANDRTLAYIWLDLDDAQSTLQLDVLAEMLDDVPVDTGDPIPKVLFNEYLIRAGFACRFAREDIDTLYLEQQLIIAERVAKLHSEGIWRTCPGQPIQYCQ
jgi:endonuclease YncB( thermonuclease family)